MSTKNFFGSNILFSNVRNEQINTVAPLTCFVHGCFYLQSNLCVARTTQKNPPWFGGQGPAASMLVGGGQGRTRHMEGDQSKLEHFLKLMYDKFTILRHFRHHYQTKHGYQKTNAFKRFDLLGNFISKVWNICV